MIDGSVPAKDRMEMVDNFNNNDDVKVFLIMLKSGGTGLNLATADVVIHLDLCGIHKLKTKQLIELTE